MSRFNWSRRAALALTLLATGVLAACGGNDSRSASAALTVLVPQALSSADVARVRVEVSGPGITSPISAELSQSGGSWQGTLTNVPAGTGRTFRATAHDAASNLLFAGEAGPVTIDPGQTASVAILLQQVDAPPPFENEAPRIDSVVVSSNPVEPGGTVTLTANAHDANPGDTLRYVWSATAGSFGSPGSATTSWTAPATEGAQRIQLEVVDSRGASATLSIDIGVARPGSTGGSVVTAGFNTWPTITSMNGAPSVLVVDGSTRLTASVSDADGDAPRYSWSSECAGRFDDASLASPRFTLSALPGTGRCLFRLSVSDGRGGQHAGTLVLHAGAPLPDGAPVLEAVWLSSSTAAGGELVTLGVAAHDPEGQPLTFSWTASVGGFAGEPRSIPNRSEIDWKAPPCFSEPALITVSITDVAGSVASQAFVITPRPGTECSSTTVTGVRNTLYVPSEGSVVAAPDDLSTTAIGAWVPTADGSGYTWAAGSGQPNGTFSISGVGSPSYLLSFGRDYIWTSQHNLDLSHAALGRPGVELEPAGTQLDLQLDGLSPWTGLDDLQLHAPSVGLDWVSTAGCVLPEGFPLPPEGGTSLWGSTDYGAYVGACGNKPVRFNPPYEPLYVGQLAGRSDAVTGIDYQELRRGLVSSGLERTASGSLLLKGTLGVLPTFPQTLTVRSSEFEALALAAHPTATLSYSSVDLGTLQGYSEFGAYTGWPDLGLAYDSTPGDGDFSPAFQVGDFFPPQWPLFTNVLVVSTVRYAIDLPGGGTSRTASYSVTMTALAPLTRGSSPVIVPRVGPARALQLNGLDATGKLTGVGTSPLLSWTAPALGVPTYYQLRLYRLVALSGGSLSRQAVATLYTPQTQVRLPPGLLKTGENYYVQVASYFRPGADVSNPYRQTSTSFSASAVTGVFQP